MERDEFIKSLGLGVALICTGSCLSSCGGDKNDDPGQAGPGKGPATGTKADIDLATQLLAVGSFTTVSGVLFVRLAAGNAISSFTATQADCPHQGGTLNWISASNLIQCALHNAQYSSAGQVVRQPVGGGTTRALKLYPLSISGTTLTATVV